MCTKRYPLSAKRYIDKVYGVILVGGKGKRLRPLSTDSRPKPFLSITKDHKTIFKKTLDRIGKLISPENILVVANRRHADLVRNDFHDIEEANLLLEPVSRNTAPAIAWAASLLAKRSRDAIMVVLPSDQYISNEGDFLNSIKEGIDFIEAMEDALLVLAVSPSFASTEFGYLNIKDIEAGSIYKVAKFVEKPSLDKAKVYLESKAYLWNAGGFIFRAGSILRAMETRAPEIFNALKNLGEAKIDVLYKKLPDIAIDYAVFEKADNIYCVKGSYGWSDVGNFHALRDVLKMESRDFVENNGKIVDIL